MSSHGIALVVLVLIWLVVCLVVAGHASDNNRNPVLWGAIVMLLGIWGIIVYVLVLVFDTNPNK